MTQIPQIRFITDDVTVSSIGFGAAGLGNVYGDMDDNAAIDIVRYAHELGITYYDTSQFYGIGESERRLGLGIAPIRDEVFLASKGGRFDVKLEDGFDFSYGAIIEHCEASLTRLGVDYIDLYQLHDVEFGDERVVAEEAIPALHQLRADGKVRFIGITGYPTDLLARLAKGNDVDTVLSYCRYNLMDRTLDTQLSGMARSGEITLLNASVLHMGLLTPKGPQSWHPAPARIKAAARRVIAICEAAGVDVAALSTAFSLANPDVSVTILGSNRRATLDRSLAAQSHVVDQELIAAIDTALGDDLNLAWTSGRSEHHEPGALAPEES